MYWQAGGNHYIINFIDDHSDMLWSTLSRKKVMPYKYQRMVSPVRKRLAILLNAIALTMVASSHQIPSKCTLTHRCQTWGDSTIYIIPKWEIWTVSLNHHGPCKSNKIIFKHTTQTCGASVFLHQHYVKNWTLGSDPKLKTPYKCGIKMKPDISHMRELERAWCWETHNPKIYDHSIECVLSSDTHQLKAYQCYNRLTGHIHTSRNVDLHWLTRQCRVTLGPNPTVTQDKEARNDQNTPMHKNWRKLHDQDNTTAKTPKNSPTMFIPNKSTNSDRSCIKGLPYVQGWTESCKKCEEPLSVVRQSRQQNEAHTSCDDKHWTPLAPEDDDETCLFRNGWWSLEILKAMKAYNKPEWDQGIEDEWKSLCPNKVWTLIPRLSNNHQSTCHQIQVTFCPQMEWTWWHHMKESSSCGKRFQPDSELIIKKCSHQ